MAAIRTCFLSTLEPYSIGDVIEGSADDPCVFASLSADTVLRLFGFGSAIYKTRGQPCAHRYADHNWRPAAITPQGGYQPWDFSAGQLGISVFDKLEVIEVIRERFFGRNGAQVITAVEWFRSLFVERDDEEELQILPQFRSAHESMWRYYRNRLTGATFDVSIMLPDPDWKTLRNRSGARARARPWLRPSRLRDAWNTALVAAAESKRLDQCRWLSAGSPALAALTLRELLPVTSFRIMYEPMEELIPLSALDEKAPPVVRA